MTTREQAIEAAIDGAIDAAADRDGSLGAFTPGQLAYNVNAAVLRALGAAATVTTPSELEWAQRFTLVLFSDALPGEWLSADAVDAAAAKALARVGPPPTPADLDTLRAERDAAVKRAEEAEAQRDAARSALAQCGQQWREDVDARRCKHGVPFDHSRGCVSCKQPRLTNADIASVRAEERERCAAVCDEAAAKWAASRVAELAAEDGDEVRAHRMFASSEQSRALAARIRALGDVLGRGEGGLLPAERSRLMLTRAEGIDVGRRCWLDGRAGFGGESRERNEMLAAHDAVLVTEYVLNARSSR